MNTDTTNARKSYQCRHIHAAGARCGSRSLRGEEFCYFHQTARKPAPQVLYETPSKATFTLPYPEDRAAIQQAIGEILNRLTTNNLDTKRAGLLLYALQIATQTLPPEPRESTTRKSKRHHLHYEINGPDLDENETPEDIEYHETLGPLAPVAEYIEEERPIIGRRLLDELEAQEQAREEALQNGETIDLQAAAEPPKRKRCAPQDASLRESKPNLPGAPRPADVVAHRHHDQHEERKESGRNCHLDQLRLILHVHKEKDHHHSLEARDRQRNHRVCPLQVDIRRPHRDPRKHQERGKHQQILERRDNMMFRVLRIHHIRGIVIFNMVRHRIRPFRTPGREGRFSAVGAG
jgi:hypothetical protein